MKTLLMKCTFIFVLLLTAVVGNIAFAQKATAPLCQRILNPFSTHSLSEMSRLRLMTYNLENFFLDTSGDYVRVKDPAKVAEISKVILDQRPDIIVVEEAQNQAAVEMFNQQYLHDSYRVIVLPGNDGRGINVGFLVKRSLAVDLEVQSHRDYPSSEESGNFGSPLFSRDLPALLIRNNKTSKPALIVFANHGKSKKNRAGDPESNKLRTAQIQAIAEIAAGYSNKFGTETPMIVTGDFNTDVQHGPEMIPLRRDFVDAFEMNPTPRSEQERTTHTFHPRKGAPEMHEMDAFFLNQPLRSAVKSVRVYRYRNELGQPKPLPQTFEERGRNPSDHFPVVMDLSIQPLLQNH